MYICKCKSLRRSLFPWLKIVEDFKSVYVYVYMIVNIYVVFTNFNCKINFGVRPSIRQGVEFRIFDSLNSYFYVVNTF